MDTPNKEPSHGDANVDEAIDLSDYEKTLGTSFKVYKIILDAEILPQKSVCVYFLRLRRLYCS